MIVKDVFWINIDIFEAEVEITDGNYSLVCFSCDKNVCKGDSVNASLLAIEISEVKLIEKEYHIQRTDSSFEHYVKGQLSNNRSQLNIGNISINIDKNMVPGDIVDGDFVEANISRIDIFW